MTENRVTFVPIEPNMKKEVMNRKQICAVMTGDARYSLSPEMHNNGYEALGISDKFEYIRLSVKPDELKEQMAKIKDSKSNFRGISVGVPHKQAVIQYLDEIDDAAQAIGAVNTIVVDREKNGIVKLKGTNTDWLGFTTALKEKVKNIKGKKFAVVGAGGTARATLFALKKQDPDAHITIYNRTPENAQRLAEQFGCKAFGLANLHEISKVDVIVHATNQGMHGEEPIIPPQYLRPGQVVVEWDYSKEIAETRLEQEAKKRGAIVIEGRKILLGQAVGQFELFTGYKAPVEMMEKPLV